MRENRVTEKQELEVRRGKAGRVRFTRRNLPNGDGPAAFGDRDRRAFPTRSSPVLAPLDADARTPEVTGKHRLNAGAREHSLIFCTRFASPRRRIVRISFSFFRVQRLNLTTVTVYGRQLDRDSLNRPPFPDLIRMFARVHPVRGYVIVN